MNWSILLMVGSLILFVSHTPVYSGGPERLSQNTLRSDNTTMWLAGSVGGTVGRGKKDISGSSKKSKTPSAKKKSSRGCSGLTGKWNSWASFLFGKGDVTFTRGGRLIHGSGIKGTWRCKGGRITVKWNGDPNYYKLKKSANGRQLVHDNGKVSFRR